MKKIIYGGVALLLLTAVSCKKRQMNKLEDTVIDGSWRITHVTHHDIDETAAYAGSTFTFGPGGKLTVSGSVNLTGTWDVRKESSDDDWFDDRHVELYVSLPAPYNELTEDWELEKRSDTRISLKDDSEKHDDDDRLVFEKW